MTSSSVALFLYHSRSSGTAKVVGIGIGEHDGDGGSFPSMATLARYANVSVSNVKKGIQTLVDLGEIRVTTNGGGRRDTPEHERPNMYEVLLECPANCDGTKHHRLMCVVCGERLWPANYSTGMHTKCLAKSRIQAREDTPTPYQEQPPPVGRPGSTEYPNPVSQTGYEQHPEPPTTATETPSVSNRAREDALQEAEADLERWLEECPGRWGRDKGPHELNGHGLCSHCSQPFHVTPDGGLRPGRASAIAGSRRGAA